MPQAPIDLERLDRWIAAGSYIQAYHALLTGLETWPGNEGLLAASSHLAAVLRSDSWDLGTNKATEQSEQVFEIEAMLRLVIRLNGEGIYGVAPDGR